MVSAVIRVYKEAFSGLPRSVWMLSGLALVNRAGTMVFPFLSLYMTRELGLSIETAGWILLAFGAGSIAGSYAGGWLTVRLGAIRVQELSLLSGGLVFVLLAWVRTAPVLAAGAFLASALGDAFRPAVMSAITDASPKGLEARGFGLLRLAVNLGMAIGPALGGLLALYSYTYLFFVDGGTCILAGILTWWVLGRAERQRRAASPKESAPKPAGQRARRDLPFLLFLGLVFLFALAFFQVFCSMPLYLRDAYGFDESAIGTLLGFNALLIVLFEMLLVRSMENRNPLRVFGVGCVLTCGGLFLLPFGSSILFAGLTVLVWSLGEMLALPFSNAIIATRAARGNSGEYMGLYSVAFSTAFMVAPVVGLWVYGRFGGDVLCYCIGATGLLIAAILAVLPADFLGRPELSAGDGEPCE